MQGRNTKWNKKFPEFPIFRKRVQLREVDRNFGNECPETVCFIRLSTRISENFGRMECARNFLLQRWTFGLFRAVYIFFYFINYNCMLSKCVWIIDRRFYCILFEVINKNLIGPGLD